jgi:hypothetical protein
MNKEELKQQYDELVSGIETAKMFDGRNSGVDLYQCKDCGFQFYTRYKDKGVTSFTIRCRNCDHGTAVHEKTITEQIASFMGVKVHNWVRPTFEQLLKLSDGAIEHVLNGGLILEDELKSSEDEIKEKFDKVQEILDSLQGSDATCMFIGHEGNHFVISGNPTNIEAQIVFAMCRYPVVKDIIKTCATRFDELNEEFGDGVRNVTMDHLIEINSGN